MAIEGHKNRALLRRGLQVKEALQRRSVISETALLRRNINETIEEDKDLEILCRGFVMYKGGKKTYEKCPLVDVLENEPTESLKSETLEALKLIDKEVSPSTRNKTIFRRIVDIVMETDNPSNTFRVIAAYLKDPSHGTDLIRKNLKNLRVSTEIKELESFLKKVRNITYTEYEDSFKSDNFDVARGSIKLDTGYNKNFYEVLLDIHDKRITLDKAIRTINNAIVSTKPENLVNKLDLVVKQDLKVGYKTILKAGSKVEVKKMDYKLDSYFSEFFSIYKNPKLLPPFAHTARFKALYRKVVNKLYLSLLKNGQGVLDSILNNISAIIYDNNLIVLTKDIELYWSNKGQRNCDEPRLSIRYRVKHSEITAFQYNKQKHSNQLVPLYKTFDLQSVKFCPVN